jgi:hypothetical protein
LISIISKRFYREEINMPTKAKIIRAASSMITVKAIANASRIRFQPSWIRALMLLY